MPSHEHSTDLSELPAHSQRLKPRGTRKTLTGDRLVAFLYALLRDHLPAGQVTQMIQDIEKCEGEFALSNPLLAGMAIEFRHRLFGYDPEIARDIAIDRIS